MAADSPRLPPQDQPESGLGVSRRRAPAGVLTCMGGLTSMRTQPEVRGARTRTVLPRDEIALGLDAVTMLVLGGGSSWVVIGAGTWAMGGR
jgi:hypothetical protein